MNNQDQLTQLLWRVAWPDRRPPALNELLRTHWAKRKKWIKLLTEYIVTYGHPYPQIEGPVRVLFDRQRGPRNQPLDRDNLVASFKIVGDVITKPKGKKTYGLGIIEDDDNDTIKSLVCKQNRVKSIKDRMTVVEIYRYRDSEGGDA